MLRHGKFALASAALVLLIAAGACGAEETLSIEECIAVSLAENPSIKSAKGALRLQTAQFEGLRVNDRVTVGFSASGRHNGNLEDANERTNGSSASLTASKTLYDTGRNRLRKEIQRESVLGALEDERLARTEVAADAKRAYYSLVLKLMNRDVEREKVNSLEGHLRIAQGQYEVGTSSFIDVTRAEADLANARVSLLRAENDILTARETLCTAMGTDDARTLSPSTPLCLPPGPGGMDALLETAMADRPDYIRAQHNVRARELGVKSAARSSSPSITGSVSASFGRDEGKDSTKTYGGAINISIPVVDAGSAAAETEAARAQLMQSEAALEASAMKISQGVRTAALSLANAIERAGAAELSVRHAEENLELAQGRYEVGVGNAIELSDAVSTLSSARYSYYQALYDAQAARADLDQAMGHLPPEAE